MKKLFLIVLSLGSLSVYSMEPLEKFAAGVAFGFCVDEVVIEDTVINADDFFEDAYEEAWNNADENTTVTKKASVFAGVFNSYSEIFCEKPQRAQKALSMLFENFDEIEGLMVEVYETGDDDSYATFTVVMKNSTYSRFTFQN
ncbi:MAG: hypothetical protein H6621_11495 [Halobacteriovoraceae bacterium]|nr:hypothetical protein [Halobacteriovoraceae bacterium]MCB9095684.1 hypothetical protein [Halobacteriovoraceae bacterium]